MRKFHEQASSVVFTFGRFNPPTTGHEKLLDKLKSVAGTSRYVVFPSQSQNQKKDPLPFALKIAYMRKMFPKHSRSILADKKVYNAFDIVVKLFNEKYTDVTMVVGSDRVKEFQTILDKYNGVTGKRHGFYKFNTINVVSAGERDPDAEGVSGMSASKMRAAASLGDFESFKLGLPKGFKDGENLFNDVRKYMGIREERDMGLMTDYEQLRDAYLTGDVWNIDDLIEAKGITGKIIRRGTNYVAFVDEDNKVHKAWLHEINPFAGGMLDPSPVLRKLMGRLNPKIIANVVKRYVDGVNKGQDKGGSATDVYGKNSKNKLIADIVQQFGLERRYGMSARGIRKFINKLVDKGKLDRKYQVEQKEIRKVKQAKGEVGDVKGTQPAKYYAKGAKGKGMAKSTAVSRARFFAKGADKPDNDPDSYKPAPGDKGKKTKPSQYTQKFKQMYGEKLGKDADMGDYIKDFAKSDSPQFKGKSKEKRKDMAIAAYLSRNEEMEILDEKIAGLVKKSKQTGVPYGILKKSYDRGMAAWKTGHRPGTTPQQWAFARVNSMLTGGKADPDLQPQARAAKKRKKAAGKKEGFASDAQRRAAFAQGYKAKGKKDKKEEIKEWFESNVTRAKYQMHHGEDWWWKMNEVHDKMLEKIDADCCDDCVELDEAKFGHVHKGKVIEVGSQSDMNKSAKKKGAIVYPPSPNFRQSKKQDTNYVINSPGVKVGDTPKTFKEEGGPEHEITVGNYTTKFFYMCGSAQKVMKTNSMKPGAETLTKMQDDFYKLEKEVMDAGEATPEQKAIAREMYNKIMRTAGDLKLADDIDDYMKSHIDSIEKGDPKPGFGRTDLDESLWANIHKKRQRIKQGSGEKMRKKGEKGAPTAKQMKRAKGEGYQKFNQFILRNHWGEVTEKAEYQGRPVELNNPTRGDKKKFKVYVKNDKGNVVKVEYGDPNMSIKRDDPGRRASFRARHNCDNPGPKYKARYWSCKFWSTKSVTDLMKG